MEFVAALGSVAVPRPMSIQQDCATRMEWQSLGGVAMLKNIRDLLAEQAPDLLARTKLSRKDPAYLTQRQAFDLHRKTRLDELKNNAPDLYQRINLPHTDENHLTSSHAFAIYRGRSQSKASPSSDGGVNESN